MKPVHPVRWWRTLAVAAASSILGACATTAPMKSDTVEASVQAAPEAPAEPRTSISGDMLYRLLVAELAGRRGQLGAALEYYLSAAQDTDDPRIAERAARIAVYARDNERARIAAERWVELAPDSVDARQVIATLYIRLGNVERAEHELEQVVTLAGDGRDKGLTLVASLLGREENHRIALEILDRLLQRYPDSAALHFTQGSLADRVGDRQLALKSVDRAIDLRPDFSEAILLQAKVLIDAGRADEAFDNLTDAQARDPDNLALQLGHARLLVEAGQFERAAVEMRKLYTVHEQNHNVVYTLGLLAIESRRFEDARDYLQQVIRLGARTNDANYYLGRIAESQRDYETATNHYLQVTNGDNQLDAQIRVAEMLARLDRLPEALDHLRNLRIMFPSPGNAVRFYLAEAEILRQAGRYGESMRVLTEALEEIPDNNDLLYSRALAAEKVDRPDVVESDLRKVLQSEPDNAHALNALGYYLADRTDRLPEANELITRALELLPEDPAVIDSMGWLQYRLGDHEKALEYLQRAYEKFPDPEIAAHLGEVLWVMGDREGASQVWERALKEAPEDGVLRRVMQRFNQ